jgi:hypothetical protein
VVVEKVPFAGDLGQGDPSPRRGPLAGWVRLAKGPRLVARPLRPAEAFATLLACAPYVNRDRWREPVLEGNLARLLGGVPALELEVPRGVVIEEVERALAAG